jgi:hypothetical protein
VGDADDVTGWCPGDFGVGGLFEVVRDRCDEPSIGDLGVDRCAVARDDFERVRPRARPAVIVERVPARDSRGAAEL